MPACCSNRVRWLLLASLTLLAVLWLLVGCGATQEGQKDNPQQVIEPPVVGEFVGEVPQLGAFLALVALEPQEGEEGEARAAPLPRGTDRRRFLDSERADSRHGRCSPGAS